MINSNISPNEQLPSSSGTGQVAKKERRRGRRRLLTWLSFGLVGLIMGVVWAVGVASSTAVVDTAGADPALQVFGTASAAPGASVYAGLLTAVTPLTIDFTGWWGRIDVDTTMFDVDLSAQSGTFFVDVYLSNNPTGWAALQLEFRRVTKACGDVTLVSADWDAAATSVMVVEDEDAYATFSGLAAPGVYCIGIRDIAPKANDSAGTFIRRPAGGAAPTAPVFAAVLNRTS
ncbi:MAG: hypothetical protein ACE5KX_04880 [Acidimicrobiia bacterium]